MPSTISVPPSSSPPEPTLWLTASAPPTPTISTSSVCTTSKTITCRPRTSVRMAMDAR